VDLFVILLLKVLSLVAKKISKYFLNIKEIYFNKLLKLNLNYNSIGKHIFLSKKLVKF